MIQTIIDPTNCSNPLSTVHIFFLIESYGPIKLTSSHKLTQHIESKLNVDEKETLELDVRIDEIKNV